MAISFVGNGTAAVGTTSVSVPYPTVSAGDLIILFVANKYPSNGPSTPSGWTLVGQASGGAGASGLDTGNVYITAYSKVADGTETGSQVVTIGAGNASIGRMFAWSKSASATWSAAVGTNLSQNAAFTSLTATFSGVNVRVGDAVIIGFAVNTNDYTLSLVDITASGTTFSNKSSAGSGTTNGDDASLFVARAGASSGSSSADVDLSITSSGSAASAPAGAFILLLLRESGVTTSNPIRRRIKNFICLPKKTSMTDLSDIFKEKFDRD